MRKLYDPWGDIYLIAIDGDYDNSIPHQPSTATLT